MNDNNSKMNGISMFERCITDKTLGYSARIVYVWLYYHKPQGRRGYTIEDGEVAKAMGVNRTTLQRLFRELNLAGYISYSHRYSLRGKWDSRDIILLTGQEDEDWEDDE